MKTTPFLRLFKFVIPLFISAGVLFSSCQNGETEMAPDPGTESITAPEGFRVEHLYSPTDNEKGSWVAMTFDDQGRMITADQYGGLYRLEIPESGDVDPTTVERLVVGEETDSTIGIGFAHGLLYAFNSLYVVVNHENRGGFGGRGGNQMQMERSSGVYRLQDTNGDDQYDQITTIKMLNGQGEHGPHSLKVSPDGQSLYYVGGNMVAMPELDKYRVARGPAVRVNALEANAEEDVRPIYWKEDNLYPQILDPRGHANNTPPQGAWVAKFNPDGSNWELIGTGMRNPFDIDFNEAGDLFAYDADMEWDVGSPHYRPTRIVHVVDGAEFGWRTGNGKFSPKYIDNLPPVANIGPGSPTNLVSTVGAKFPEEYRNTLLAFDWTYATMYAVHLQPEGSTYTANVEDFIFGTPLPLTDGTIGPDGALYFLTGGRRVQSDLYKVTYTEDMEPVGGAIEPNELNKLRRSIEQYHEQNGEAVDAVWQYLSHDDRFIRFSARVAIEHQPVSEWQERVLSEENPVALTTAMVALAHQGNVSVRDRALQVLMGVDYSSLSEAQQLDLLRAIELVLFRMEIPSGATRNQLIAYLDPKYPANSNDLNRALSRILVALEAPSAVPKTLQILAAAEDESVDGDAAMRYNDLILRNTQYGMDLARTITKHPPLQQTYLATVLSEAESGWTPELREQYFSWFEEAFSYEAGNSYIGFINRAREAALTNVPASMQAHYNEISGGGMVNQGGGGRGGRGRAGTSLIDNAPRPEGPGRQWTLEEASAWIDGELGGRNFENGRNMFLASCASCHVMQGQGGNIGHDLTQVGTRFTKRDILNAIVNPNDEISDQYATTTLGLRQGGAVVGRIMREDEVNYYVSQNPFLPDMQREVPKADVISVSLSDTSLMPGNTVNQMNEEELKDLIGYLISGGNADHEVFN